MVNIPGQKPDVLFVAPGTNILIRKQQECNLMLPIQGLRLRQKMREYSLSVYRAECCEPEQR